MVNGETNLVTSGGFESVSRAENLWDGVDGQGRLKVFKWSYPNAVDMNGDGLEELITGGYSTEEPFTNPNLKFFVIEPRKGGEMGDYEITHEFEFVTGAGSDIIQFTSSIGSIGTDIDSDSKKEVAVGYATLTGDDSTAWYILERDETQFRPIWYHLTAGEASYRGLATGDGDQDRHWELVFNEPNYYTFALYEHD